MSAAASWLRGDERAQLPQELADVLTAKAMGWGDWEVFQRQPRIWRQMCQDFVLAGGLWRG